MAQSAMQDPKDAYVDKTKSTKPDGCREDPEPAPAPPPEPVPLVTPLPKEPPCESES